MGAGLFRLYTGKTSEFDSLKVYRGGHSQIPEYRHGDSPMGDGANTTDENTLSVTGFRCARARDGIK
jgi:hypothetical protein